MRSVPVLWVLLLGVAIIPIPVRSHEVEPEIQWGRSVAVRARSHHGASLAGADAEVFSPRDGSVPRWRGRTDPDGWVAFVPDLPGRWRVRIVGADGHGLDASVDVPDGLAADGGSGHSGSSPLATLARPLAGLAIVGVVFGALALRRRNRGA